MPKNYSKKVLSSNKKARFNYDIKKTFIAGIVLKGYEVKSVMNGSASLKDGYIRMDRGEAFLINVHIPLWKFANVKNYDPTRRRKLLLQKREISSLDAMQNSKNMAIVPLEFFIRGKGGKIKLLIGTGKGRKRYDKRRYKKEKEMKREIRDDLEGRKTF